MRIYPIEAIIDDIRQGKMVVIVDDEDRENEGDIILAAEKVTPSHIAFMARAACGLICLPLTPAHCQRLGLSPIVGNHPNRSRVAANFTLPIEATTGVLTGISAQDRAHTILTAIKADATAESIVQPGHVFPLMAHEKGVLGRRGHTEAGVDLARAAGLTPAAVLCEILNEDGTLARGEALAQFAERHQLKIGKVADLVEYQQRVMTGEKPTYVNS